MGKKSLKNSFDVPSSIPRNIFPTIDYNKKGYASSGSQQYTNQLPKQVSALHTTLQTAQGKKQPPSSIGPVKASFYNPSSISHYKKDYHMLMQKEVTSRLQKGLGASAETNGSPVHYFG